MITSKDWFYTSYISSKLQAYISIESGPVDPEKLTYLVNVSNLDFSKDFFQRSFQSLEMAIDFLNLEYGSWKLHQRRDNSSESCNSCSAH